jgi:hypothetical protein
MSMREVEPGVNLIMDTTTLDEGPVWQERVSADLEEST